MKKGKYRWNVSLVDLYTGEKVAGFHDLNDEDFKLRVKLLRLKIR